MDVDLVCSGSGMNLFAFAGAVSAAADAGYTFRRVAGVSGGGLIATALAAGYQPGHELTQALLSLTPVVNLLDPRVQLRWPWNKAVPRTALADQTPWWWPFESHGLVRGEKLEKTVAALLKAKGVVTFRDLKKPLSVFTTVVDPPSGGMEWSQAATPNAEVALAAVASCRIPGLFEERNLLGHQHVDGGVWDNFPIDCWNTQPSGAPSFGENTLGFYFGHSGGMPAGLEYLGAMGAVVNIMMASRALENIKDAPRARVVRLPEGNALDFLIDRARADAMISNGYQATKVALESRPN